MKKFLLSAIGLFTSACFLNNQNAIKTGENSIYKNINLNTLPQDGTIISKRYIKRDNTTIINNIQKYNLYKDSLRTLRIFK